MSYVGNNPKFITQTYRPQSADPTNPTEGQVQYADGTARTESLYMYKNGAWVQIGSDVVSATSSLQLSNFGLSASVAASALTIAARTSAGINASAGDKSTIGFRNATSATGQYAPIDITGALSLTIPSTATMNQSNGVAAYIYVYLINNAGTAELGVSRSIFDEGSIVSTTVLDTASDFSAPMYSTTARSNVAARLVGRILNSQATAGTWATAPSEISLMPFTIEKVFASYNTATGSVVTGSSTRIDYGTKIIDNLNSVVTGASWLFTAPRAAIYQISATITSASGTTFSGIEQFTIICRINGVDNLYRYDFPNGPGLDVRGSNTFSYAVSLAAGGTIGINLRQDSGGTLNIEADGTTNRVTILEA